MQVYQLNEIDWWMANSIEEAIATAMQETGCSREEVVDDTFRSEPLSDEELDRLKFVAVDEEGEEPDSGWPIRSFREELARRSGSGGKPGIFAMRA